jgi:hypothetical protein
MRSLNPSSMNTTSQAALLSKKTSRRKHGKPLAEAVPRDGHLELLETMARSVPQLLEAIV